MQSQNHRGKEMPAETITIIKPESRGAHVILLIILQSLEKLGLLFLESKVLT